MMDFVLARILFLLEIVQLVIWLFFAWWGFNIIMGVGSYKDDDEGQR